jgi:hypothetical protein
MDHVLIDTGTLRRQSYCTNTTHKGLVTKRGSVIMKSRMWLVYVDL